MTAELIYPTDQLAELVGVQQVVRVPSPAAGTDWLYTLPAGYFYRLLLGCATLTASATVVSRFPGFTYTDGTLTLWSTVSTFAVAASQAGIVSYGSTIMNGITGTGFGRAALGIPRPWLLQGFTLGSQTANLQTGDQWSAVTLWLECLTRDDHGEPINAANRHDYPHGTRPTSTRDTPAEPRQPRRVTRGV